MDPSKMDKRTKEYKEWAAKQKQTNGDVSVKFDEPNNVGVVSGSVDIKATNVTDEPVVDDLEALKAENKRLRLEVAGSKLSRRTPTKPWDKVDGNHRSFRPNRFMIKAKTPEIDRKWKTFYSTPERVEVRQAMDYEVAPKSDYEFSGGRIDDGSGEAGPITKGGLVLMRKPRDMYDREQAYKEELRKRQRRINRLENVKQEAAALDEPGSVIEYTKERE